MADGSTSRGESAKGRRRREQLVSAAAELLLAEGPSGLSHRAVAGRAGLPLSATTYYFGSLEDLVDAAMSQVAEAWTGAAARTVAVLPARLEGVDAVARAVVAVLTASPTGGPADREAMLAVYERYVQAGRHPRLAALVTAWNDEVQTLLGEVLDRGGLAGSTTDASAVLAVADGALLRALGEGRETDAAVTVVAAVLAALPRQRQPSSGAR